MPGARILHAGRRADVSDSQFRSVCTLESLIHPQLREDAVFVSGDTKTGSPAILVIRSDPINRPALRVRRSAPQRSRGLFTACRPPRIARERASPDRRVMVGPSKLGQPA